MGRRNYTIQAVVKAFQVEDYLARHDILSHKSAAQVAVATGLPANDVFRILETMVVCGRAEKGEGGYRTAAGIIGYAVDYQDYLAHQAKRLGIRSVV